MTKDEVARPKRPSTRSWTSSVISYLTHHIQFSVHVHFKVLALAICFENTKLAISFIKRASHEILLLALSSAGS